MESIRVMESIRAMPLSARKPEPLSSKEIIEELMIPICLRCPKPIEQCNGRRCNRIKKAYKIAKEAFKQDKVSHNNRKGYFIEGADERVFT